MELMRWLPALVLCSVAACAQPAPFTLDQALSAAFPTELTAAPAGGKVAWASDARGVRNIMVAEAPAYQARKVTNYTLDDGQELRDLRWTADAAAMVYVRGGAGGAAEEVWIAGLDGSAARKIGAGSSPAVAPRGGRIAFVRDGQIWWASVDGKTGPVQAFAVRGECRQPRWSPDGARLAFTSDRGDHSLIGVYDAGAGAVRYLDPATDYDSQPAWSPDGRSVAFLRIPSSGAREVREARRAGEPWSIRIASAVTGEGRLAWRARPGAGSVFREVSAREQLLWTAAGRIVFPWEGDGWTHLYAVPVDGGPAALLTPGGYEVEDVAPAPGSLIVYSSNQGDSERRHLWEVGAGGGAPVAITSGAGIECSPAPMEGALAFLRSNARLPLRAAIRVGTDVRDMDAAAIPPDFPAARMVAPQPVVFAAADGLPIHGQLFLPPGPASAPAPAVVFFHGGPHRQMLLGWHSMAYYSNAYALNQFLANAGYVVLAVNFRGGSGYGLDFREAPGYGPSGASEYNDVRGAAAYLEGRAGVDRSRIGVWGGSYGGYLTAMALARDSDTFRAGVDFHGVHNWATELRIPPGDADYKVAFDSSPMAFLKGWRSPALLIAGDDDPDVQFNQTVMLTDALRRQKVEIETLILPDEVHEFLLHRSWLAAYEAAVRFLNQRLK